MTALMPDRTCQFTPGDRLRHLAPRAHAQRLLRLAQHLHPRDHHVLEQLYEHGTAMSELARRLDMPRHRLVHRVEQLLRLIDSPAFRFLVLHQPMLPDDLARTARAVILHRQSLRETARSTRQSLYQVRKHIAAFHAMMQQAHLQQALIAPTRHADMDDDFDPQDVAGGAYALD